jgi:hypothetical protein
MRLADLLPNDSKNQAGTWSSEEGIISKTERSAIPRCPSSNGLGQSELFPMETPESRQGVALCDRLPDGKNRVTTSSWDDAKVILPNQVLEVAVFKEKVGPVPGGQAGAYLDMDDTGLVEAGYGRAKGWCDAVTGCNDVTEECDAMTTDEKGRRYGVIKPFEKHALTAAAKASRSSRSRGLR